MLLKLEPGQLYASAVVITIIAILISRFVLFFVLQAARTIWSLRKIRRRVREASQRVDFKVAAFSQLNAVFDGSREDAAWQAYSKTLVPEKHSSDDGVDVTIGWHTASPAEVFFTPSALVEVPLKTEFFKHLPGILTGLGIIGTFIGIITGLFGVDLGADQAQTLQFLNKLMHTVGSAFVVSAVAISCATIVTLVEKWLFATAIGELAMLANLLDRLFNKDLTDINLERLVIASERSATQTAQLKDSLVTDLKELLDELATRNAESLKAQTEDLSRNLSDSIRTSLDEPIGRITEAVNSISSSQGDAVNRLLTDMIASFTERFEGIAGRQNAEMTRLLTETTQSIQNISADFLNLSASLKEAGAGAVDAMGDRLSAILERVSASQEATNQAFDTFLETLSSNMSASHDAFNREQTEAIENLSSASSELINRMQSRGEAIAEEQQHQHAAFSEQVSQITGALSKTLDELLERNTRAITALEANVSSLTKTTTSAIGGIENGAVKLQDATLALALAGEDLAKSLGEVSELSTEIVSAANRLAHASALLDKSITLNQSFVEQSAQISSELKQIVETARREAGVTAELVTGIETAATKISNASKEAEEFLRQIGEVLATSHREFSSGIQGTLKTVSQEFHRGLSEAVGLLSGSINDLRGYLDELTDSLSSRGT